MFVCVTVEKIHLARKKLGGSVQHQALFISLYLCIYICPINNIFS